MIVHQFVNVLESYSKFEILDLKYFQDESGKTYVDFVPFIEGMVTGDRSVTTYNAQTDLQYERIYSQYHVTKISHRLVESKEDVSNLTVIYQIYVR